MIKSAAGVFRSSVNAKSLSALCGISGRLRLMRTGAKLRAELSVSLPAELKTGETETTGCICCGLFFCMLPAAFAASLLYFGESMIY